MDVNKEKEPTAGTRGFVKGLLNTANQETIWDRRLGINEKAIMLGVTPYQKTNIVRWSFLNQKTKHLPIGSNNYGDFVAKVEARSATMVKLNLIGWRPCGTQNYHTVAKLTNRPLPVIELFTSGEVVADEICRGKLVKLTARITADEGRMLFKVGPAGLKAIEFEGTQEGLHP
jgi:hypothetical protein